jgi:hypothetical protein
MQWGNLQYFLEQFIKKLIQKFISLHFFGKNDLQFFSKVIPLALSYKF